MPAKFGFIPKLDQENVTKPWLTINHQSGLIRPGMYVCIYVCLIAQVEILDENVINALTSCLGDSFTVTFKVLADDVATPALNTGEVGTVLYCIVLYWIMYAITHRIITGHD